MQHGSGRALPPILYTLRPILFVFTHLQASHSAVDACPRGTAEAPTTRPGPAPVSANRLWRDPFRHGDGSHGPRTCSRRCVCRIAQELVTTVVAVGLASHGVRRQSPINFHYLLVSLAATGATIAARHLPDRRGPCKLAHHALVPEQVRGGSDPVSQPSSHPAIAKCADMPPLELNAEWYCVPLRWQ